MTYQERRASRSPALLAAAAIALVAAVGAAVFFGMNWSAKIRAQVPQADGPRFAWLSQALDACEAEAAKYPQGLYFMVVPLTAASSAADGIKSRALETVGPAILLESKVAL